MHGLELVVTLALIVIVQAAALYLPVEKEAALSAAVTRSYFPHRWDVIGPFPSSSREQGADVLEAFGGILALQRGSNDSFPSELVSQWGGHQAGRIDWSSAEAADDGTVNVDFGDLRWEFMQDAFGSSIRRGRGWAIGDFSVPKDAIYSTCCEGVSTYLLGRTDLINGDSYRTGWRAGPARLALFRDTHAACSFQQRRVDGVVPLRGGRVRVGSCASCSH